MIVVACLRDPKCGENPAFLGLSEHAGWKAATQGFVSFGLNFAAALAEALFAFILQTSFADPVAQTSHSPGKVKPHTRKLRRIHRMTGRRDIHNFGPNL